MPEATKTSDPTPMEEQEEPESAEENKEKQADEWKELMGQDLQMKVSSSQVTRYNDFLVCRKGYELHSSIVCR